jgi:hypothetical protein
MQNYAGNNQTEPVEMEEMIAFCGLACNECDAFVATKTKMTPGEKLKLAEKWTKLYGNGRTVKPEEVMCVGCLSENGQMWTNCSRCEIRKCGQTKKVTNCAYCADYPCGKLKTFFMEAPDAKIRLDAIR